MRRKNRVQLARTAVVLLVWSFATIGIAQGRTAAAKSLRCSFRINVTATWKKEGSPDATLSPSTLLLIVDSINTDEGTARLKSGSVGAEIVARLSGGYLHFIQSFRTGPLYSTTVFDQETSEGKLKAVHSRHENFAVLRPGATSSP
ncbi:MAG: hypothetical protein ABJA98_05810 [Acidobacteriota bacterium]